MASAQPANASLRESAYNNSFFFLKSTNQDLNTKHFLKDVICTYVMYATERIKPNIQPLGVEQFITLFFFFLKKIQNEHE